MQEFESDDFDEEFISKTQIKQEAEQHQQLGLKIMALKPSLWQQFPLTERLLAALEESKRITKNEAKRRHAQFVGRLMRHADIEKIEHQLALLDSSSQEFQQIASLAERWRERLLTDKQAMTEYIQEFQPDDIQALRQLIRNTRKEIEQNSKEQQAADAAERKALLKNKAYKQLYKTVKKQIETHQPE